MIADIEDVLLRGLPISKGIGIGFPVFFSALDEDVPVISISITEIEGEILRYQQALDKSRKDLRKLQKMSLHEGPPEVIAILGTHLEIMEDPLITTVIEEKIRQRKQNIETIFYQVIEEYKERFNSLQDTYFQERVRDLVDVFRRILGHLQLLGRARMAEMPHNSVILTHELVPSETVEASSALVSAFVTAAGGITSHAAIIARAKGIPYVANVDIKFLKKITLQSIIVDGSEGIVIINPSKQSLKKYQEIKKGYLHNYKQLKNSAHLKGETIDGYEIRIFANIENPKEIDLLHKNGAAGIGLFRSEYLFLSRRQFPSEDEQFEIYKKMVRSLRGRPFVIRIFDVGGDKKVDLLPEDPDAKYFMAIGNEQNPALGCRAVRFLLRFPEILQTQLRAILRASKYGEIQILIPMVSDVSELRAVRKMIEDLQAAMRRDGMKITKEISIGCMIEVPSSVIMCEALAQEADFLSIGTNDLVQYVLAADRSNPNISDLYFSTHPSILRLIRMVVSAANRVRKPVILCGECAADPNMIPILIGLGIRELSVSARHIPLVKHIIRKWRILDACRLAEAAFEYPSAQELKAFLTAEAVR
jgi:phosphotransferase system enzyme I (PtsI)